LRGVPASPGSVEGRARVVISPAEIPEIDAGEILVCPATAPAWAPVFGHIAAAVSDVGGTMCHAAILCREYHIPAVLGTGHATRRIKTGDLLRVDGTAGVVTILSRAT
jgi:pyruvate,water dikinase